MSWRAITEDDVHASMTSAEMTAVRTKLLTTGQTDPLAKVIEQVTLEIRESVRSCKDNKLSEDVSLIPAGLVYHGVAIIRYRLLSRFGLVIEHGGESRKEEHKIAVRKLELVAECKHAVERYGDAEDEAAPSSSPSITAPDRKFSRKHQDGI